MQVRKLWSFELEAKLLYADYFPTNLTEIGEFFKIKIDVYRWYVVPVPNIFRLCQIVSVLWLVHTGPNPNQWKGHKT